ncbi:MAG: lysylphosphatidylglycerol synthase transmembrane domain-containing protein [Bacteroidota bacterium]
MKPGIIKILKFSAFLALGILLLYFAFKGIDFQSIKEDFRNVEYSWVLFSLVFSILSHISRAMRWNILIEPLGFNPRLKNTFYSLMVGYLANFAFPRIGEITRCAGLGKKENIPVDKLVGTVIVERMIDLMSLVILLGILIIFRFETFGTFFRESVFIPLGEKISQTLAFSMFIWIIFGGGIVISIILYIIFREQLSQIKIVSRGKNIIKGIAEGLKSVYMLRKRGKFLFHTAFIWMNYWLMTWVVVFALPATSDLKLIDGLFLLVIGGFGMSAPVQSGIGAYHWIVSRGLVAVYAGITLEEGLVFATISHEAQSLLVILLGSLSFILLFRKQKIKGKLSLSEEKMKEAL